MKERLYPMDRCDVDGRRAPHLRRGRPHAAWPSSTRRPSTSSPSASCARTTRSSWPAFAGFPASRPTSRSRPTTRAACSAPCATWGPGAEISGGLDFEATRRAGFPPDDIVFDGPCKTEEDLRDAIDVGVHLINVECESELPLIDRLARERRRVVKVGVRIDPVIKNPSYGKLISTYKQKFGFPVNDCAADLRAGPSAARTSRWSGCTPTSARRSPPPGSTPPTSPSSWSWRPRLKQSGVDHPRDQPGRRLPGAQHDPAPRVAAACASPACSRSWASWRRRCPTSRPTARPSGRPTRRAAGASASGRPSPRSPAAAWSATPAWWSGRVRVVKGSWVFTDVSINDVPENLFFTEFRLFYPEPDARAAPSRKVHLSGPTLATNDVVMYDVEAPELRPGDPHRHLRHGRLLDQPLQPVHAPAQRRLLHHGRRPGRGHPPPRDGGGRDAHAGVAHPSPRRREPARGAGGERGPRA